MSTTYRLPEAVAALMAALANEAERAEEWARRDALAAAYVGGYVTATRKVSADR